MSAGRQAGRSTYGHRSLLRPVFVRYSYSSVILPPLRTTIPVLVRVLVMYYSTGTRTSLYCYCTVTATRTILRYCWLYRTVRDAIVRYVMPGRDGGYSYSSVTWAISYGTCNRGPRAPSGRRRIYCTRTVDSVDQRTKMLVCPQVSVSLVAYCIYSTGTVPYPARYGIVSGRTPH